MDASGVKITSGNKEDMTNIITMIKDLAAFEGVPEVVKITEKDLIRDGFENTEAWFFTVVAKKDDKIIGYALCNRAYSSWVGRSYYIEDIFVLPEYRGLRIGHEILKEVCRRAHGNNVHRIDWHVLTDNKIARDFYDKHGAYDLCAAENRTAYRMDEAQIKKVSMS